MWQLGRSSSQFSAHGGFGLTRDHSKGQMTLTGNYDHSYTRTISDRPFNLADVFRRRLQEATSTANPSDMISTC
jgi:hypothetical protein